jgi:bifunctional ADP-heptose synthase (sugar kinase/adenylyltransferase)
MLTDSRLEQILGRIPRLTIGVLGDLFLDRYLDIDATLTEPSLETGLDAYQVVRVRSYPGAAGTVINNLAALGVQRVIPLAVIGDDGEGHELTQALGDLGVIDAMRWIFSCEGRRTPTYTKPMLHRPGQPPRELNRLDIKNRTPLPQQTEAEMLSKLHEEWPEIDALIVLDQVSEAECGIITTRIREHLGHLGDTDPGKLILADSRERVGQFRSVCLKPNIAECRRAVYGSDPGPADDRQPVLELARRAGRPVFCTVGSQGMLLADPRRPEGSVIPIPAFPVAGPTDPVGAGDSTSAAIACAVAAAATLDEAAAFGNLVASITIQQVGTTGTATPAQVRQRWRQLSPSVPEGEGQG